MHAKRIATWALVLSLGTLGVSRAQANPEDEPKKRDDSGTIVIREMLAIGKVSKGGRVAVFQDAVEAQLAAGTWKPPKAGDTLGLPGEKSKVWKPITANEKGVFNDPALRGGYAVATVTVPEATVMLLNARGHRHLYVNGVPRGGDVYNAGITRIAVPLEKGANELLFKGGRGRMRASLEPAPAPNFIELKDATLPHDLTRDGAPALEPSAWVGLSITNATDAWTTSRVVDPKRPASNMATPAIRLPPFGTQRVAVAVERLGRKTAGEDVTTLMLFDTEGAELHQANLSIKTRTATEDHLRSFVSEIDGSVQVFGVSPASSKDAKGLVLSCHGAGVQPMNQVGAYAHKDWCTVVAPTNRRPFGFDWEDWGRLDFLEVKAEAERLFKPDPSQVHLTGHSMGGHGTWILGAQFPDRFGAIAPSAGWRDFWSYGGGAEWDDPTPTQQMLMRASNVSRTMLLRDNYSHHGIYVLHGDADTNVPVTQARYMRERLATFHRNFAYFEQPGAGHWWGNRCVDWEPLFQFIRHNPIPTPRSQEQVQFATVNPAVSDACYWARIVSQLRSLERSRIDVRLDPAKRELTLRTTNVARLELDLRPFTQEETRGRGEKQKTVVPLPPGEPLTLLVGEERLTRDWPEDGVLRLMVDAEQTWITTSLAPASEKGPHRAGPFKEAFRNRFLMVVGTKGTPEENTWALGKARYDGETWQYRGNGRAEIIRDTDFDVQATAGRNVILYGHRDMNAAWNEVLDACPIEVNRGRLRVGAKTLEGADLGCLFVYPRKGDAKASVGVIAGTGLPGMRVTTQMPIFLSGAGFPDWLVVGAEMPLQGTKGICGSGFFDLRWRIGPDSAWAN